MTPADLLAHALQRLPLVAILRGLRPEEALDIGHALCNEGWHLLEVPLNSPQPLRSIELMAQAFPQALVGAGTVMTAQQVRQVHDAGGRLIVCPHLDEEVVAEALSLGLLALPGVATPSEAFAALRLGAHALKLFPAEMIPPAAVKAVRAVLPPQTVLLPVGGIVVDAMAGYRAAGASGFGIGSALYAPGRDALAVREQARRFAQAWRSG
jgi:2-dehydro-3-deoxyphosphogalactonate aldolase